MKIMKKQSGFTLIELMIVVFVMAIVAGALIISFRQGERQRRTNLMRDTVISAFRTAQNYTLSGRQIPPAAQAPHVRGNARCVNDNAALSYWVEFTTSNDFDVMAQDRCGAVIRIQRFNGIAQTRFLTTNPFVLTTGAGPTNSNTIAVRFTPPFGVMSATSATAPLPTSFNPFVSATITIEYQDGQRQRTIRVDGISGRID
jgi:prepilin-type N-terminal cleavage/methylation domain-containing protein